MATDEDDPDDDGLMKCWCGAEGTYDDLFDDDCLDDCCGGTGSLECYCGGDICVCHHHGEVECPGCPDCEHDDEEDWDAGDDFDDIPY